MALARVTSSFIGANGFCYEPGQVIEPDGGVGDMWARRGLIEWIEPAVETAMRRPVTEKAVKRLDRQTRE